MHGASTLISVGANEGEGALYVKDGANVKVGNGLFIAGPGYYTTKPSDYDTYTDNSGYVYVGEGSSLEIGAHEDLTDPSGSQLNIGWVGEGVKGTMLVEGGMVKTNASMSVALSSNSNGELTIDKGGKVIVDVATRMTSGISATYIGYNPGSNGKVTVTNGSTLEQLSSRAGSNAQSYIGMYGTGTLEINNKSTVNFKKDTYGLTILGYAQNGNGTINVDDSSLEMSTTYLGYSGSSNGSLNATNGAGVNIVGNLHVGGYYTGSTNATGTVNISDANTSIHITGTVNIGYNGTGDFNVNNGAVANIDGYFVLGMNETAGGTATVDGANSTIEAVGAYIGNYGNGNLTVTNGATFKSTDDMSIQTNSKVSVNNGNLHVTGTMYNDGTTDIALSTGNKVNIGAVYNTGTMTVNVKEGGTYAVGTIVNDDGTYTITSSTDAVVKFDAIELINGNLKLEGAGSFELGASVSESGEGTVFTVVDNGQGEAEATGLIDISGLTGATFTINKDAMFTLSFETGMIDSLITEGINELTITLITGNESFTLSDTQLQKLITDQTQYVFREDGTMVYAVAEEETSTKKYEVSEARYEMQGTNLVWTGSFKAVPEPATASLSLLGLAALLLRRRRA